MKQTPRILLGLLLATTLGCGHNENEIVITPKDKLLVHRKITDSTSHSPRSH